MGRRMLFILSMICCTAGVAVSLATDTHMGWVIYFSVCLAAGFISEIIGTLTREEV